MNHSRVGSAITALMLSLSGVALSAEERGHVGILFGPIPEAVEAHLGTKEGVIVEMVTPGSPAEKAGIRRHDIVVAVGAKSVSGPEDFRSRVLATKPGDVLRFGLRRGTQSLEMDVTLGSQPVVGEPQKEAAPPAPPEPEARRGFLGVGFAEVPPLLAAHLGLGEGAGVLVGDVWKDSPAAKAGIESNAVLVAIDGYEVKGPEDFLRLLREKKPGDSLKVEVIQKGARRTVDVTLAERPKDLPDVGSEPEFDKWFERRGPWDADPNTPRSYRFRGPGSWHRGRIIIQGPDGKQQVFEFPEVLFDWKAEHLDKELEKLQKDLEQKFGKLQEFYQSANPERLTRKLEDFLKEFRGKPAGDGGDWKWSAAERHAIVRIIDGGYDITIQDRDGKRTFTVKKGDEVVADNLPFEKLDTLPQDVRDRVQKAEENLKMPEPAEAPKEGAKEGKIKA